MLSIFRFSALLLFLVSATAEDRIAQQRLEPGPPGQNYFSEAPISNVGISGAALFARQQAYVCTDPSYSVQCLAVIGKCCQTGTYCCPNNLPFCCMEGDTCEVVNGKQGCCPNSYEKCDGKQCGSPGSVCCNDYNHVCNSGDDCCKSGCCAAGTKCCGDTCCEAGNQCCPNANGGQGGCCYPGQICCGESCCNSATQYCSGNICLRKVTPTSTVFMTSTVTAELGTGLASSWRGSNNALFVLVAVSLGVAFEFMGLF